MQFDYTGGVGIIHYSNVSISDENCIVKHTVPDEDKNNPFHDAICACYYRSRSRLLYFYGNLINLRIMNFCFSGTTNLTRFNANWKSEEDNVTDGNFEGSFDKLILAQNNFRNKTQCVYMNLKFPKLVYSNGNFYGNTGIKNVNSNYSNCVKAANEYEECSALSSVTFEGGLPYLVSACGMFRGCTSLENFICTGDEKFTYALPRLLEGDGMFDGCKLNVESVIRILESLPNILKIKDAIGNGDKDTDITTGNYWGYKYDLQKKKLVYIGDLENKWQIRDKEPVNEDTEQVIGRVFYQSALDRILIYYKCAYRKPNFNKTQSDSDETQSDSDETLLIGWKWETFPILLKNLGTIDIGCDSGVISNNGVQDALKDAREVRGWNVNLTTT